MLDHRDQAALLVSRMKHVLPIEARKLAEPAEPPRAGLPTIRPMDRYSIVDVEDRGSDEGIVCIVEPIRADAPGVVTAPLTDLRVDPRHFLARDIAAYQKSRTQQQHRGARQSAGMARAAAG